MKSCCDIIICSDAKSYYPGGTGSFEIKTWLETLIEARTIYSSNSIGTSILPSLSSY